jgi:hypothetical protein
MNVLTSPYFYRIFFREKHVVPELLVLDKKLVTHMSISVVSPVLKIWIEEYVRHECRGMLYKIVLIVYVVFIHC